MVGYLQNDPSSAEKRRKKKNLTLISLPILGRTLPESSVARAHSQMKTTTPRPRKRPF